MTLFDLMGLLSTVALALPIIFMVVTRLAWYKCFPALLIYSVLMLSFNLTSLGFVPASDSFVTNQRLVINLLDAPLMLCFLTYFSQTAAFRKSLLFFLSAYIAFELVVLLIVGFNKTSNTIIMAPGLLITLLLTFTFFIHYVKLTLVNQKALGKLLMAFSLLLAYGVYCFIYVVLSMMDTAFVNDTRIIFYLVTSISSLGLCAGLLAERNRVRYLSELHKTREELKAIYGEEETNTTIPFETVVFKFEKGKTY